MHPRLIEQLDQYLRDISPATSQWQEFLNAVSQQYAQQSQIEQALANCNKQAARVQNELQALLSNIPDMYFRFNNADRVLDFKCQHSCPLLNSRQQDERDLNTPSFYNAHLREVFSTSAYQQLIPAILDAKRTHQLQHTEIQHHQTGALGVYEAKIFPLEDNGLLILLGDVSQSKLQEYQLQEAYDRITHQNKVLISLTEQIEGSTDSHHMLRNICIATAQALGIARVGIWLLQENGDYFQCEIEYDSLYKRFNTGQIEARKLYPEHYDTLRQSRSLAFNDAIEQFASNKRTRAHLEEHNILSLIHAPIRANGNFLGLLRGYESRISHDWTPDEQQFFASIADLISLIFQQQNREYVIAALDESEVRFKSLAQATDTSIFAFRGAIVYANGAMEKMSGFNETALKLLPISVVMGEYFAEQFSTEELRTVDEGFRRRLEIEFTNRSGEVRWAYVSVAATLFGGKLTWLASAFDITERKRAEVQLRYQAYHDPLTGLPNRAGLIIQIDQCLLKTNRDRYYKFALLYLDIDRFKLINDNLGHMFGDELLIEIGLRIRKLTEVTQTVSRLGGDEFVILIDSIQNNDDAILMAERILNEVRKPFVSEGQTILATASIGITIGDRNSEKAEHLLRNADVAMYQAKDKGKNRYALYDALMHAKAQRVIDIERDLRLRLANNSFQLLYTPIVNVQNSISVGFVADIKWSDDKLNNLTDDDYQNLANDCGIIQPIEDWLIQRTLTQINQFNHPYLYLAVKISGSSLGDLGAIKRINQALERSQKSNTQIQIECSEAQLMHTIQMQPQTLEYIKRLNCALVLDNFGIGSSSISILSQLPIKAIKIDEKIIANLTASNSHQIVKTLVDMGRSLGLEVVAKGVNSVVQLDLLRKMNCPFVQGELFAEMIDEQSAVNLIDRPWRL